VAKVDRRAHDHVVVLVVGHAEDERLVDLHDVDRQALELPERGEAGTEVVDGEGDGSVRTTVPHPT
jgi:hypothetical protein